MKKNLKLIICLITIISFTTTSAAQTFNEQISNEKKTNNPQPTSSNIVYVGWMHIYGTANHDTSVVEAYAKNDMRINVDREGSTITFKAEYYMNCPGLFDTGYVKLWVQNGEEAEYEEGEFSEGYLFAKKYDCKRGDVISWALTVIYDDLLFPYPLVDFDAGSGYCPFPFTKISHFPIIKNIFVKMGRIFCE